MLYPYWKSRGSYAEVRLQFNPLLENRDVPDRSRAELFGLLSDAEPLVGDLEASETAARQSISLTEPGDELHAYALLGLAIVSGVRGEPEEAVQLVREVLEEINALDDRRREFYRMDIANIFADVGLWAEARTMFMQASDEARRLGNVVLVDLVRSNSCWLETFSSGASEPADMGSGPC